MENIYGGGTYNKAYHIDNKKIRNIVFYNDKGIVYTGHDFGTTGQKDEHGNLIYPYYVRVLQVKRVSGKKDTEKHQELLNKLLKSKTNFSLSVVGERDRNEFLTDLYLYVDNKFIEILDLSIRQSVYVSQSSLTKTIYTYNLMKVRIAQTTLELETFDNQTQADTELIQAQAKALYEKVRGVMYIEEDKFNQLFNQYELIKRTEPLLKEVV